MRAPAIPRSANSCVAASMMRWYVAAPRAVRTARPCLAPLQRRDLRPDDLAVRVDYCGVCHTDLHALGGHDGDAPLVPGHEFTGVVTETGPAVTRFSAGDPVAIGNIVDSCGQCPMCRAGQENFCHAFPTLTYGGTDRQDGTTTLGGYSREYVVRDRFAYPLPAGLGHLAVKLAVALGADTSVISRSPGKADDERRLGAQALIVSTDPAQMAEARDRFDVVIDTISAPHDVGPYLRLVAMDGTLSHLGDLGPVTVETMDLLVGRKKLSSAGSGGRPGTEAMLAFCAEKGVTADIELLPSARVNEALDRLRRNDVRYRFVLGMSDLD
ncbi:NAD(P)-dependent alcohol dehydrogenase [Actinomadura napierensis]